MSYVYGQSISPAAQAQIDNLTHQVAVLQERNEALGDAVRTLRNAARRQNAPRRLHPVPEPTLKEDPIARFWEEVQAELDRLHQTHPQRPGVGTVRLAILNHEISAVTQNRRAAALHTQHMKDAA